MVALKFSVNWEHYYSGIHVWVQVSVAAAATTTTTTTNTTTINVSSNSPTTKSATIQLLHRSLLYLVQTFFSG